MLVQEGLGVIIDPFNFNFFSISVWGIDLHYCDVEWFALETNRDYSFIFEIAPKYCILDSSVSLLYQQSSIYSKQSIIMESNPEYSLEGLMLKRQCFGP